MWSKKSGQISESGNHLDPTSFAILVVILPTLNFFQKPCLHFILESQTYAYQSTPEPFSQPVGRDTLKKLVRDVSPPPPQKKKKPIDLIGSPMLYQKIARVCFTCVEKQTNRIFTIKTNILLSKNTFVEKTFVI